MITLDDLRAICPRTKSGRLAVFVEPLNYTMIEFEIDNGAREAAFLAQIAHESGGFNYVEELADGSAYDERADLGNTRVDAISIAESHGSTAGKWWKGHGLIQITGFDNHLACGNALGLDLLNNPRLLCEPSNATRSAAWYWHSRGLNELADKGDFRAITKKINGGYNGWQDRVAYLERAQNVLG